MPSWSRREASLFLPVLSNYELQQWLKNVDRSSLIINKDKGTKAYRAVENADYQTQANAFRSLFKK